MYCIHRLCRVLRDGTRRVMPWMWWKWGSTRSDAKDTLGECPSAWPFLNTSCLPRLNPLYGSWRIYDHLCMFEVLFCSFLKSILQSSKVEMIRVSGEALWSNWNGRHNFVFFWRKWVRLGAVEELGDGRGFCRGKTRAHSAWASCSQGFQWFSQCFTMLRKLRRLVSCMSWSHFKTLHAQENH